jgi:non-ribosomal peptide synthetase component E (peptide arylation enzyme)
MEFHPHSPHTLLAAVLKHTDKFHYNLQASVTFCMLNAVTQKTKFLSMFCTWENMELNIIVCLYQLPLAGRVLIARGRDIRARPGTVTASQQSAHTVGISNN